MLARPAMFSTTDQDTQDQTAVADDESRPLSKSSLVVLSLLVVAAYLLYLYTAQSQWSIAVVSLKPCWNHLHLGWWLYRRDDAVMRGLACGLLSLARGVLMSAWVAFLLLIALTFIDFLCGEKRDQFDRIGSSFFIFIVMFPCVSLCALFIAKAAGIKLWTSIDLRRFWHGDIWPPNPCDTNNFPTIVVYLRLTLTVIIADFCGNRNFGIPIWWFWIILFFIVGPLVGYVNEPALIPEDCWKSEYLNIDEGSG